MKEDYKSLHTSLRLTPKVRKALGELSEANGMNLTQIVNFLVLKARASPELFGLTAPKEQKK